MVISFISAPISELITLEDQNDSGDLSAAENLSLPQSSMMAMMMDNHSRCDTLICGQCQKEFKLADISNFINHKAFIYLT